MKTAPITAYNLGDKVKPNIPVAALAANAVGVVKKVYPPFRSNNYVEEYEVEFDGSTPAATSLYFSKAELSPSL